MPTFLLKLTMLPISSLPGPTISPSTFRLNPFIEILDRAVPDRKPFNTIAPNPGSSSIAQDGEIIEVYRHVIGCSAHNDQTIARRHKIVHDLVGTRRCDWSARRDCRLSRCHHAVNAETEGNKTGRQKPMIVACLTMLLLLIALR
jgi:hypothetical protein